MKLVILSAGFSTRFGKLKQFYEIDDKHQFILDYSLKEAKKAGFDDFVFIIRKETQVLFINTIYQRIKEFAKVSYYFQEMNDNKSFGTANALKVLFNKINEPFMVMNADDLYSYDAFKKGYEFLNNINNNKYHYANICYYAVNTIYSEKEVSRGLISEQNGLIKEINEVKIKKDNNKLFSDDSLINDYDKVSMNLFCFTPDVLTLLNDVKSQEDELILTNVIDALIKDNKIKVEAITTMDQIIGLTYQEDLEYLINIINKNIKH